MTSKTYMKVIQKRRAIRQKKTDNDKQLLAIERELSRLCRIRASAPSILLPKPIQDGYKRHLVLRSDVANRTDAPILKEILKRISVVQYSKTEKFEKWDPHTKKFIPREKHLTPIGVGEFKRLTDKTYNGGAGWNEQHLKFFNKTPTTHWWIKEGGWTRSFEGHWFTGHDYWFEWYVEPHFLTHYKEPDPELESKIDRLYKKLWDNWKNNGRLHKLHGWKGWRHSEWSRSPNAKIADDIMKEFMKEFLDHSVDSQIE